MFHRNNICGLTVLVLVLSTNANLVRIKQGAVWGTTMESRNGTKFNAYLGIPYAQPPIGNLRFMPPLDAKPWKGILNATETPPECIQISDNRAGTEGVEDCLNLNIYTPLNAKPGDNIPVIVYIFGGIFKVKSNVANGPQYFMNRNVIIVMPNYRLGVLGFLSTGDSIISGNMGLKDQLLALKWTKKNIYAFGGDPDRITLQGHSSGAMCVHLHTLSPLSKGFFNRVIIQSGTSFSPISIFSRDVSRSLAIELAHRVGCPTILSNEILKCFLKLEAVIFPMAQEEMYIWEDQPNAAFRPTIEDTNVTNAFLTQVPIKMKYHSADFPMLIGITTGEAAYMASGFLTNGGKAARELDSHPDELFPVTLQYLWTSKPKDQSFITSAVRSKYFGNNPINDVTAEQLMNMYTSGLFVRDVNIAIRQYEGPRYVYMYDYWSNYSTQNKNGPYRRLGISHAEELHLIFRHESSAPYLTERDIAFGDELITRWVNFAYSGNPNKPLAINTSMFSTWNSVASKSIEYLRIKLNGTMETNYCKKEYRFWKNLPEFSKFD